MAPTPSTMAPLGMKAPAFRLPDLSGKMVSLDDFRSAPALLVAFICTHCPFVKHIRSEFAKLARDYQKRGVAILAISSNDVAAWPDDSPEKMAEEAKSAGYSFPYLFDETQGVAKAYRAACTPDFYVFDRDRRLVYRGQMDDSRPSNSIHVTGSDLRHALDAVLDGRAVSTDQKASVGCNIKWKAGNEPEYYGVQAVATK
jgi:peroxiredoxin